MWLDFVEWVPFKLRDFARLINSISEREWQLMIDKEGQG
jgi:hypothetical protein